MIRISSRDVVASSKFGRYWLGPNGEEYNIAHQSHEVWAEDNVSRLYKNWQNLFLKYGENMGIEYDEKTMPMYFLYLMGWTRIWDDSIITTEKQLKHVKDFMIMHQNSANPEDSVYFTIYKNDLNGIRTSTDSIKDWVN
jgi:hypothetical protein